MKEEAKKDFSEENVVILGGMGYSRNACIRALKKNHDNVEAALNWIFENMDQNLDAPLEE